MMNTNIILISIKSKYASKILNGTKSVELRKSRPKLVGEGDLALIYVPFPVQALVGAFSIQKIEENSPHLLWMRVREIAGVNEEEFKTYFNGSLKGVAVYFEKVWNFPQPVSLRSLKKSISCFNIPQCFRYITDKEKLSPPLTSCLKFIERE